MRAVDVAHLHARAVAGEATGAERREPALVSQPRERVVLVHELRQLRLVGSTFLKVIEERDFPFENLYLMASKRSADKVIKFKSKDYVVEELCEEAFDKDIDIALFSAGGDISKKYSPIAASKGITVVDNSSRALEISLLSCCHGFDGTGLGFTAIHN